MADVGFLNDLPSRGPWPAPDGTPDSITPVQYWLGKDERYPLEVLFAESPTRSSPECLERLARQSARTSPAGYQL